MSSIEQLVEEMVRGARPPGVYRLRSAAHADTVLEAVAARGWRAFYLDGSQVHDKAGFLAGIAAALAFPPYFGHNWDAFEEMVNDLSWAPAPGYVLLYDEVGQFACADPERWAVAQDILGEAAGQWHAAGRPFFVLLRHTQGCVAGVERL
jgi:hypothetical protein